MNRIVRLLVALLVLGCLTGCGFIPLYSYANKPLGAQESKLLSPIKTLTRSLEPVSPLASGSYLASYQIPWNIDPACRDRWPGSAESPVEMCRRTGQATDPNLIAIAISGGGSRAAVFSAEVLFELQRYGILQQADVISCVSGGCITAAYYELSCDDRQEDCPGTVTGPRRFEWRPAEVYDLLSRDYIARWIGNWFWPQNIALFWFTHYDRTDIMAETLSHNLYDSSFLNNDRFRFRDLNPQRPNLIINATNSTAAVEEDLHFDFTREYFTASLGSDLDLYPVANAVMASATFPGVFNYVTLRDFQRQRYMHLFDGGTSDNLGLTAINRILGAHDPGGRPRAAVFVIDAYRSPDNSKASLAEPRDNFDYLFDSNLLTAYDTLLTSIRSSKLDELRKLFPAHRRSMPVHITLPDLHHIPGQEELADIVNRIPTTLTIDDMEVVCLRRAARVLVASKIPELRDDEVIGPILRASTPAEPEALPECRRIEPPLNLPSPEP